MTGSATAGQGRRMMGWGVLIAACAGLVALGVTAADDGISYYRTPSEVVDEARPGDTVRLGGLVVPGSLSESRSGSTMVLTDGVRDVSVTYPGRFPDVVLEGEGAVVDGDVSADGSVDAETIVLRHSNEYQAPDAEAP